MTHRDDRRRRWSAMMVLCLGVLMIVLDTTIVHVALPSIRADLRFAESSLVWVVNAYLLTFGGFLLLSGRLGDLFGHRKLFLIGIVCFTIASVVCGLANSQGLLIAARAIQGLGGAVVTSVALSLIVNLFTAPAERTKAMGIYGFICAGGGGLGVLLGGLLTSALSWHWIFLVNLPIGTAVYVLGVMLLPRASEQAGTKRIDLAGSATITASLMLTVYAIVNGNDAGWRSVQTLGVLTIAALMFVLFLCIEKRVRFPLMPLGLFRQRNLTVANMVGILWAGAMFGWSFSASLYLQLVLGYTPMQIGLAFLPANVLTAAVSLGASARLVMRFGLRSLVSCGLLLIAAGLALFAHAPANASFVVDVLPGMLLLGVGAGMALNPVLLAAMSDVSPAESGLASGIVNTSFMMGGAVGLAVLASLAAGRSQALMASGWDTIASLSSGYRASFMAGAMFAAGGAVLAASLLRTGTYVGGFNRADQAGSIP